MPGYSLNEKESQLIIELHQKSPAAVNILKGQGWRFSSGSWIRMATPEGKRALTITQRMLDRLMEN